MLATGAGVNTVATVITMTTVAKDIPASMTITSKQELKHARVNRISNKADSLLAPMQKNAPVRQV
jgi:outer membrane receptor for ferric coprogen and ferric-rhodotorulic acid